MRSPEIESIYWVIHGRYRNVAAIVHCEHLGRRRWAAKARKYFHCAAENDHKMNAPTTAPRAAGSDYEFVRKFLSRVARAKQKRRLMPEEAGPVQAVEERWRLVGKTIALRPGQREVLLGLVRKIEARMKTAPYAPFR